MTTFAARRRRNLLIMVCFGLPGIVIYQAYTLSLNRGSFLSGWFLFTLMVALALYNARKKLSFLPVLSSSFWLQFHIYVGILCVGLFALHIGWRVPGGVLGGILTLLFFIVAGSGILGLVLSRSIPARLTTRSEEVIFERIPGYMMQLREQVRQLVEEARTVTDTTESGDTLSDFYTRRLVAFFHQPKNFWWHLLQSNRPRYTLLKELEALDRYLNNEEKIMALALIDIIGAKDDLDYQYAHQAILKYWLFIHIPMTYSLLLFALAHGMLAHAYGGGI